MLRALLIPNTGRPVYLANMIVVLILNVALGVMLVALLFCGSLYAAEIPSTVVSSATSALFSPDGSLLACTEPNGKRESLKLYEPTTGVCLRTICSAKNIRSHMFSSDGRLLACTESNGANSTLKLYETATGTCLRTICSARDIYSPMFSSDGRLLACTEDNGKNESLKLYEPKSATHLRTICSAKNIYAQFSPNGSLLACSERYHNTSCSLKLYESTTGTCLFTVCSTQSVGEPVFSPDGRMLACTEFDTKRERLKLYEVANGTCLRTVCSAQSIGNPVFNQDGRLLACTERESVTSSTSLKLYESATGTILHTIQSAKSIRSPVFSADGRFIAFKEGDEYIAVSVKLYTTTGTSLRTVCAGRTIGSLAFNSDGSMIACREGNTLKVYKLHKDESLARFVSPQTPLTTAKPSSTPEIAVSEHKPLNKPSKPFTPPVGEVTPEDSPVADKWALVVGISRFAKPEYNLRYAVKDAHDFYSYLTKEAHFAPDHVKVLIDEQATRLNIMSAFGDDWLPKVCMPGDLVVIFVSTHGTPASRDAGKKNFIVAYDTNRDQLFGSGVNMNDLCTQLRERLNTDRVLLVMDTCYAGGAANPSAKGSEQGANFDTAAFPIGNGRLVLSSSNVDQRSWESKTYKNGIFTHNLLEALRQTNGNVSVAFSKLKRSVAWEAQTTCNAAQTPVLVGNWQGSPLILTVPPSESRAVPSSLAPRPPAFKDAD